MPEPATIALDLTYAECGRSPRPGETWRILFADVGEAFIFCPECAVRAGLTPRGVRGLPHAE